MQKIVISSIGIVSLLVIPVAAQENDVKKAAQTLENLVVSEIQTKVETEARELENDTLKSLDVDLSVNDGEFAGEITGGVKLSESADNFTFTQLTAGQFDTRTTVNIGLGNRLIISDNTAILGGNIFVDYEFQSKHSRVGLGFEYITNTGSLRTNYYKGLSDTKVYKGVEEKALDGVDVKYSYRFDTKYQPEVFLRGFQWKGDAGYKENGIETGVNLKLSDSLSFSIAGRDDNKGDATFNAGIIYSIPLGEPRKPSIAATNNLPKTLNRELLYQPVQRENRIRKSQGKLGIVMTTF